MPDKSPSLRSEILAILRYAIIRSDLPIDDAMIQAVVSVPADPERLTPADETLLWQSMSRLATAIAPATPDSVLTITDLLADQRDRPFFFRKWWQDAMARKLIMGAILWILVCLPLVVGLQVYSLFLDNTLNKIALNEAKLDSLEGQIDLGRASGAGAAAGAGDIVSAHQSRLSRQRDDLLDAIDFSDQTLAALTGFVTAGFAVPGPEAVAPGGERDPDRPSIDSTARARARGIARNLHDALSLYLLPMLYGLMGANIYILRGLIAKLDDWSLTVVLLPKHRLRRALGTLMGAMIGLVYEPQNGEFSAAGFNVATLAFLAGYSAEFMFQLLDSIIARAKAALVGQTSGAPSPVPTPTPPAAARPQQPPPNPAIEVETRPGSPVGA